jgi:hypothetical protein
MCYWTSDAAAAANTKQKQSVAGHNMPNRLSKPLLNLQQRRAAAGQDQHLNAVTAYVEYIAAQARENGTDVDAGFLERARQAAEERFLAAAS